MSLKLISKYRTCLMALAMIWIGCYHTYYSPGIKILDYFIYRHGYFGIDAFVFLSGFGIYQSLKKNNNYKMYMYKRIRRLFPYCVPIFIIFFILGKENVLYTLVDCLGLSVLFRNNLVNWFTSFIFIIYLLSPIYFRFFEKNPTFFTILLVVAIIITCLVVGKFEFTYIFFRLSVYLLGFYFGYLYYHDISINTSIYYIIVILSIVGFVLIYFLNHYYRNDIMYIVPSLFIIPGLLLLTCYILEKIKVLDKPLNYLGLFTYQFYLLNVYVVNYMTNNLYGVLYKPGIHFDFIFSHSTIIITIILSIIYKKLIDFILNVIMKKEKKL